MSQVVWLTYLAISGSVPVFLNMYRLPLPAALLERLTMWSVPQPQTQVAQGPTINSIRATSKKQQKRLERELQQQINVKGAGSITKCTVSGRLVQGMEWFQSLDNQLVFLAIAATNILAHLAGVHLLDMPGNYLASAMVPAMVVCTVLHLVQVMFCLHLFSGAERAMAVVFGVVASVLSLWLLLLGPKYMIDFKLEEGSVHLSQSANALLKQRIKNQVLLDKAGAELSFDPVMLAIILSLAVGAIAMVLVAPAIRFGRIYILVAHPPAWGSSFIKFSSLATRSLQLTVILPMLVFSLWLVPIQDMCGLPAMRMAQLRAASMLLLGVMLLLQVRTMVQGYLHLGLVDWYHTSHSAVDNPQVEEVIWARNQMLNASLCRISLEMLAAGSLLTTFGLSQIAALWPGPDGEIGKSMLSIASILGWWTCLWWFLISSLTITCYRVGITNL